MTIHYFIVTQCSEPGPFDNAVVIDQTGYAPNISIFTYACKTGFYLEAGNVLNCRLGGVWDGIPPKCSGKFCFLFQMIFGSVNIYTTASRIYLGSF